MAISKQQQKVALHRIAALSERIAEIDLIGSRSQEHTALWKKRAALVMLLSIDENESIASPGQ